MNYGDFGPELLSGLYNTQGSLPKSTILSRQYWSVTSTWNELVGSQDAKMGGMTECLSFIPSFPYSLLLLLPSLPSSIPSPNLRSPLSSLPFLPSHIPSVSPLTKLITRPWGTSNCLVCLCGAVRLSNAYNVQLTAYSGDLLAPRLPGKVRVLRWPRHRQYLFH